MWGGFCHVGYQQALQCQGLQSVCIWFTQLNSTVHIVWNINKGQGGVNGSARSAGPFTPEWTTYFRTFVLRGVSIMVSTGWIYRQRVNSQCGGFSVMWVTSKLCNFRAYSQYAFGLPSWIPQYILFEILTEAREGWTGLPAGLASSPPSELRTPAHLFLRGVSVMVSTGRMYRHRVIRQCEGVSVMWVTSKLCNVRAYSQYAFGLP